jgi:sec-independent protein translocase protein TatB
VLGINGGEFLLLIVVALVVVGPERLPRYAEQLGVWVRTARAYAMNARTRVTEELGEDVADVDWAALDPRRYDPRRIVREALLDDTPPPTPAPRPTGAPRAGGRPVAGAAAGATAAGATAAGATAGGATEAGAEAVGGASGSGVTAAGNGGVVVGDGGIVDVPPSDGILIPGTPDGGVVRPVPPTDDAGITTPAAPYDDEAT